MTDEWAEKHWLNVPGPFYTGQTDNCWTGRLHAPRHVLYGGEFNGGRFYNEFVFRQPTTKAEIESVYVAAAQDPFDAYADDGDDRWTSGAVRAWWRERAKVEEHVTALLAEWTASTDPQCTEAATGARDFLAYLADGLETDLRAYLVRLERGYHPSPGDRLPQL